MAGAVFCRHIELLTQKHHDDGLALRFQLPTPEIGKTKNPSRRCIRGRLFANWSIGLNLGKLRVVRLQIGGSKWQ